MKYMISFFSLLVLLISGMLFFQFQVYSNQEEMDQGDFFYTQEIEIVYRDGSLDIRHHLKNLPNQNVNINWPKQAESPECFIETENSCVRLSEDKTKFNAGDIQNQSISYIIPVEGGLKNNQLLNNIFVTLENGHVTYSTVHITTDQHIAGSWVTGLPLLGQQSLSLVNYSMFSGTGPVNELYYQANNLQLQKKTDLISIYSPHTIPEEFIEQLNELKFLNDEHISIVHVPNLSGVNSNRILFTKNLSLESLNNDVILTQLRMKYQFGELPSWVSEVIASFLTDNLIGGEKAQEVAMTLKSRMTQEQMDLWVEKLLNLEGQTITAQLLDEQLSEVFSNYTQYFQSNLTTDGAFPLFFNDNRQLVVNGNVTDDTDVIFKDGQVLYSADTLLAHLGYDVRIGDKGFYVNNEVRKFRFPQNHGFYVYNERRFNTVSEPIKVIAGKYYIEESWLQQLFYVEINKRKDIISMNVIDPLQQ